MGENLLTNLLTYRPRPGRASQEDFLTEAFAHLIRSSGEAWKIISCLVGADALAFEELDVRTQERFRVQGSSAVSSLNNGVESFQFDPSLISGKLPVDRRFGGVALLLPGGRSLLYCLPAWNPTA